MTSDDWRAERVNGATATQNLSFIATNWATGQAVTMEAVGDADATHERVTVTHAIGAGSAAEYLTAGAVRFVVRVTDGNAGLSVTPRAVTVLAQSDPDGRDEVVTVDNRYFAFDGNAWNQGYLGDIGLPEPYNVTVVDDEEPALVVDTAPGTAGVQTGRWKCGRGAR